jgi:hypothetical protein
MRKFPAHNREPKTPITLAYAKKLLCRDSSLKSRNIPDELAKAKMAQIKLMRACRSIKAGRPIEG